MPDWSDTRDVEALIGQEMAELIPDDDLLDKLRDNILVIVTQARAASWEKGYDEARQTPDDSFCFELYGRPANPYGDKK